MRGLVLPIVDPFREHDGERAYYIAGVSIFTMQPGDEAMPRAGCVSNVPPHMARIVETIGGRDVGPPLDTEAIARGRAADAAAMRYCFVVPLAEVWGERAGEPTPMTETEAIELEARGLVRHAVIGDIAHRLPRAWPGLDRLRLACRAGGVPWPN